MKKLILFLGIVSIFGAYTAYAGVDEALKCRAGCAGKSDTDRPVCESNCYDKYL